jgi:hypothetical protein
MDSLIKDIFDTLTKQRACFYVLYEALKFGSLHPLLFRDSLAVPHVFATWADRIVVAVSDTDVAIVQ